MMTKNKIIKSQAQENWENLISDLDYIHERLDLIENHVIALKKASNSVNITAGSLINLLIEKDVFTENELKKKSVELIRDLKRQSKKNVEKIKKEDKQILYDALLKANFGGNA